MIFLLVIYDMPVVRIYITTTVITNLVTYGGKKLLLSFHQLSKKSKPLFGMLSLGPLNGVISVLMLVMGSVSKLS